MSVAYASGLGRDRFSSPDGPKRPRPCPAWTWGDGPAETRRVLHAGLRLDVSWFGFVERSVLRFDVAQTVNDNSPTQFIFAVGMPF